MIRQFLRSLCGSSGRRSRNNGFNVRRNPAYYVLTVTSSVCLMYALYEGCKMIYDWFYGYMTKQVEAIVKGLPAHESLVNGRMCLLNDTPPYLFANPTFPEDPCSFPQISSACCNHTRCDASQFMYCHTYHTHFTHHAAVVENLLRALVTFISQRHLNHT